MIFCGSWFCVENKKEKTFNKLKHSKTKFFPTFKFFFEAFLVQNFEKICKFLYEIFKRQLFKMGEFDFFVL